MESSFSLFWFENVFSKSVSATLRLQGVHVVETTGLETNGLSMPVLVVEGLENPVGIGRACTGYRSILALLALIFAVPGIGLLRKASAFLKFLPVMVIVNYLRVYSTIVLGILFGDEFFNVVHTFLWREGLIIVIILLWTYWLKSQRRLRRRAFLL
jgi:exosortase/archaeosortase family protein